MTINAIPNEAFYDPDSWIDLAPDYDWAELASEPGPIAVTATAPTFDDEANTYTVPQKTGVRYAVNGIGTSAGIKTMSADVDVRVVVTAEAEEGYVLEGTARWSYDFTKSPEEPAAPEEGGVDA